MTLFSYAPSGQLTSYTDSAAGGLPSETVATGYDAAGEANSLTGTGGYVTSLTYTNTGQPLQYTMGTAALPVYLTNTWDTQTGRLAEQNTQTGTSKASVDDLSYSYDNSGNVTEEADTPSAAPGTADVQCFQNDYLGRLVQAWAQAGGTCASAPSASAEGGAAPYWTSYSYDVTGNLTKAVSTTPSGAATTTTGTYPPAGSAQPHAITAQQIAAPGGTTTSNYAYDKAGHLTSITGGQNQAYTWNDPGKLTQDAVTTSGGVALDSTYIYDADGSLLLETDPGTTTLYLGDEELSLSGGTVTGTRYYDLDGTPIATRTGAASFAYLAGDIQATSSVAIDAATLNVTRRWYDPYGNSRGNAPASFPAGQKGFVGGTADRATGLTNLGAREYQPGLGVFISTDSVLKPTDPTDLNPYSYAQGNPSTYADPNGMHRPAGDSCGNGGCGCDPSIPSTCKYYDKRSGCASDDSKAFNDCIAAYNSKHARGSQSCTPAATYARFGPVDGPDCNGAITDGSSVPTWLRLQWAHISANATGRLAIIVAGPFRYVVTPRGTVYRIPANWVFREANNKKGIIFQDPYSVDKGNGDENSIRIAEPDLQNPNGYFRVYNNRGQPMDVNAKPGGKTGTHFDEDGPEDPIDIFTLDG